MHTGNEFHRGSTYRALTCGLAALLLLAVSITARAATPESLQFVKEVAEWNASLLHSSQRAATRSEDASVRQLASRMAEDSLKTERNLGDLCKRLGIQFPAMSQSPAAELPGSSGATFDRVYTLETSQSLAKADKLFASAGADKRLPEELKAFARERLQSVREQRGRVDALARKEAGVRPAQ
jgi:predicted outer membrane protein